jgi:hypothetical protein
VCEVGNANQRCQNPGAGFVAGVSLPPDIGDVAPTPAARVSARRVKEGRIGVLIVGTRERGWLRMISVLAIRVGVGNGEKKGQRNGGPPRRLCVVSSLLVN